MGFLIEASPDMMVTFDRDGTIIDVNQETVGVTGVSKEKLIGSFFKQYFTDPETAQQAALRVFGSHLDVGLGTQKWGILSPRHVPPESLLSPRHLPSSIPCPGPSLHPSILRF